MAVGEMKDVAVEAGGEVDGAQFPDTFLPTPYQYPDFEYRKLALQAAKGTYVLDLLADAQAIYKWLRGSPR